jgi:predicted Mrr-cat superfamily restriction endonuclease
MTPTQTWLHRISHHAEASHPLIKNGFLTIGYSDFCNPEFLERTQAGDRGYFEKAFAEMWPDNPHPRRRVNLWHFIVDVQVGDWVLVPSWGVFSVFRIESEALLIGALEAPGLTTWDNRPLLVRDDRIYAGETRLDLGFFRKVCAIASDISRYDFADAELTSRMKYRATTLDITDLTGSIEGAIAAFHKNKPINLHSQILANSAESLLELIRNQLAPEKFESLIAWYFRRIGANEVTIPPKNGSEKQGDADIIAVFEPLKTIYYVQAKHHKGDTGEWAAEQIKDFIANKDRMDDGYSKIGWVVSSADAFSQECLEVAKENSIGLFAGLDVARMILEAGIQKLDKAF